MLAVFNVLIVAGIAEAGVPARIEFHDGSAMRFVSLGEGRELIGTSDDWVRSFGPLDFQMRLDSKEPVSEAEFLDFARDQVLAWDDAEIAKMTDVIASVQGKLAALDLHLNLPDEILLVQTTGHEEGDMGAYTRGKFIVIPEARMSAAVGQIEELMLHELFHVMTRHDPDVRKPLYEIIGFTHGGAFEYPAELVPLKITNPDAYHFDSYVELTAGEDAVLVTPLTLSKSEAYVGGGIMGSVVVKFLRIEVKDGAMTPVRGDGELVLYGMNEVQGYVEKIGKNTFYIIHPEEIMADNFSLAMRQVKPIATPEILEGIVAVLSGSE
jgi:hypothetical protein